MRTKRIRNSRLRLSGYWIESLNYRANPEFEQAGDVPEPEFRLGVEYALDDTGSGNVRIVIRTSKSRKYVRPFDLDFVIAGKFTFGNQTSELNEQDKRLVKFNAPAMLYSVARGLISTLTANSVFGPIDLPSANIVASLR